MIEDRLYKKIRGKIQNDIGPVHALAPIWKRALPLLLIWLVLICLVVILTGLRNDSDLLGPWVVWGFPIVQLLIAYAMVALALRFTIPGLSVSASSLTLFALIGIAVHLAISGIVFRLSPTHVEANREMDLSLFCFLATFILSLIPSLFVVFLARQGFASHRLFLGLVCGIGCGLSGEAIWRMHCYYNSWDHILSAHTSAILAAGLAGFLIGFLSLRRRRPKSRSNQQQAKT
jgi:hypothetical protein